MDATEYAFIEGIKIRSKFIKTLDDYEYLKLIDILSEAKKIDDNIIIKYKNDYYMTNNNKLYHLKLCDHCLGGDFH